MKTNQTAPVTDEELDHLIWGIERYGLYHRQLAALKELREVRRAKGDGRDQFEGWFKFHHGEEGSIVHLHRANGGANYADPHVDLAWIAWKDSRAAMQLSGNSEQLEPVSNRDELPATQFKPVADLYGITSPTGSETSFTFDAIEAANFIEGGWSVQEYVELERYQEAMIDNLRENVNSSTNNCREISETSTNEHVRREYRASDEQVVLREYRTNHSVWIQCSKQAYESRKGEGCEVRELYERPQAGNSPATPDGWIPVSERMPDPKSELRVCVYTPTPHEDIRYRFVPASLFKAVCRDATHWHYMSAPKEVG